MSTGPGSHAEGKYTIAASPYQHVVGKYNINEPNSTYVEIVGGGTSNTARKNIRTLDWNGNETVTGSINAGTSMSIGGTSFTRENIVKWNKNSGADTSDFDLSGFILATHTSTTNSASYGLA